MTELHISAQADHPNPWGPEETPFLAIGGEQEVRALVDTFYDRMETVAPHVRALHPKNLDSSRDKLFEFLTGWLGGPQLYIEKRGHPRLRARHAPFPIDLPAVEGWMASMSAAIEDRGIKDPLRRFLLDRLSHTAHFMQNRE